MRGRIRQVVTNLTCDRQTERQAEMRVSVTDTGIGIPEEKIGILFKQFRGKGTGNLNEAQA